VKEMAITILPTSEVRDKISSVLKQLKENGEPIFITRYSKAEAVLLPISYYNAMMSLMEDREDELDSILGQRIAEARADYAKGEGRDFDSFVNDLES
jgi:PHD/YefM family antitoxin component YafN of YafNO toxin-antitoxin module